MIENICWENLESFSFEFHVFGRVFLFWKGIIFMIPVYLNYVYLLVLIKLLYLNGDNLIAYNKNKKIHLFNTSCRGLGLGGWAFISNQSQKGSKRLDERERGRGNQRHYMPCGHDQTYSKNINHIAVFTITL